MHRRDMRVRHMRDEADAGREEARILARAVDRLREIGRELAADGRDVDADLFEHLPGHHAAYPAAPFAGLHSIGLAVPGRIGERSEEHTSELQSLMRISYADSCFKKKNKQLHVK